MVGRSQLAAPVSSNSHEGKPAGVFRTVKVPGASDEFVHQTSPFRHQTRCGKTFVKQGFQGGSAAVQGAAKHRDRILGLRQIECERFLVENVRGGVLDLSDDLRNVHAAGAET